MPLCENASSIAVQEAQRDRATRYFSKFVLFFARYGTLERLQTAKVTFKGIQRHWCHSIGHIRFPVSIPLQLCSYLTTFPRYYYLLSLISQNLKRSRDSEHIPFGVIYHTCTTTPVSNSTQNLKCLALSIPKYDWGKI